ncbi:spore germination protein, partial [Bacillus altitudinis]|uniref:spore germination protein n=1 Tax=Bacillus altitudinis TaxID=293387 RepID=UPI0011A500EE
GVIRREFEKVEEGVHGGSIGVGIEREWGKGLVLGIEEKKGREVREGEIELGIMSGEEGFVEGVETNLNLVRRRVGSGDVKVVEERVGS